MTQRSRTAWISGGLVLTALLLISRAAHLNILWADEDYHLAAAVQLQHGKVLYRDVWYDKPPLNALLFLLFGAAPGWPLRLSSTLLELASVAVAFRFAGRLWAHPGEAMSYPAGFTAAAGVLFYHIFFFAHSVIPLEPDSIMVLPHLLAAYWAWSGRPLRSGIAAGLAFLLNTKGAFVLVAALLLHPAGWLAMLAGFAAPNLAALGWLATSGALPAYLDQVWRWGALYAANPAPEVWTGPIGRLLSWQAFHAGLWLGVAGLLLGARAPGDGTSQAPVSRSRTEIWRLFGWLALSFLAASLAWRFPPRYLNQVFPPLLMLAAGGIPVLWSRRWGQALLVIALLVPMVRFGPRYATLLAEDWRGEPHAWRDVALDRESREAARVIASLAQPGDTVFIWGYRPNVVAYTRLAIAGPLWDSQPVTMVPADRHFETAAPLDKAWAQQHQQQIAATRPTFLVDGLTAYNRELDIRNFPTLAAWFAQYCEVAKAGQGITIYRRCDLAR